MASQATAEAVDTAPIPAQQIPPGYFTCKRRIRILRQFQDLVRHREAWSPDTPFAAPLGTLIPADTKPEHRSQVIEREINKILIPVSVYLSSLRVTTVFTQRRQKSPKSFLDTKHPEIETFSFDIIQQYFYADTLDLNRRKLFEAMMRVLDQGIGAYEVRKSIALWELFNPALWCANLIRLPIWILQRAGFHPSQKFYQGLVKFGLATVIILIAIHYGVLTWKDLAPGIVKWLGL